MIASMKIDDVTYKFHWDKTEKRNVILETILVVIMLMIYLACIVLSVICVLKNMGLVELLPVLLFLLFVAVPICGFTIPVIRMQLATCRSLTTKLSLSDG